MKINFFKTFVIAIMVGLVISLFPITAMAAVDSKEESDISPRLSYIVEAEADLIRGNGNVTVNCLVNGHVNSATKAKVIAELQLKSGTSWIAYGTWTDIQNGYRAEVYETKSVKAGQTYRVKATVTVWEGSQSEELILFTDEMTA